MRNPLFLLTGERYDVRGAVAKEGGRYVGHDTAGVKLFDRKDFYGMKEAAKRAKLLLVSSAWYDVQS